MAKTKNDDDPGSKGDHGMCGICHKECEEEDQALSCDDCDTWFHITCEKVSKAAYKAYADKEMSISNFYWRCSDCKSQKKQKKCLEKHIIEINEKLAALKSGMVEVREVQKEDVKSLKEEIIKTKPLSYADVAKTGDRKEINAFATCVANTQKKIEVDREQRKNNVIIFNVKEEKEEDQTILDKKFQKILSEVDKNKEYKTKVERIGKKKEIVKESKNNVQPSDQTTQEIKERSRPIRVIFENTWDKRLFLSKLVNLKDKKDFEKVSVDHDMGIEDKNEKKRLVNEAKEMNKTINKDSKFKFKVRGPPWAMNIVKVPKN